MEEIKNYVGGELIPPVEKKYIDNFSPATGEIYSIVPNSQQKDVEQAIEAACSAATSWSSLPTAERAKFLRKIAAKIELYQEDLALAESIDTGKPLKIALQVDIKRSFQNFEFFADAATQFSSECYLTDQSAINYTIRSPLGVVGCISPWNLPLYLFTWKIAPALAAGNTVVAKPSELTPMTAFLLSKICTEVDLPPGVLNVIHGLGQSVGHALSIHPDIAAISFTGSTKTGADIAHATASSFKKISLEMGGKNPNIIFSDCDFENAVKTTLNSAFFNQGQVCLCGSRIFIERSIYSKFKTALIEETLKLKLGDPLDPDTNQGAVVSRAHFDKIMSYIEVAKQEGGKILIGGNSITIKGRCEKGWFIAPTLIEGLDFNCKVNQDEIFGPVATLIPFDTEEEVISWANSTRYGLAASIWTNNLKRAHQLSLQLRAGLVWVNCWMLRDLRTPFGGVKDSGLGREGGLDSLKFFTEPKNVCIKI